MAVDNDVVPSSDFRNAVDAKADELKNGYNQIHEQSREDAGPNNGRRYDVQKSRIEQVGAQLGDEGFVAFPGLLLEEDFPSLDLVEERVLLLLDLDDQLPFQSLDFVDDAFLLGHLEAGLVLRRKQVPSRFARLR